MVVDPYFIEEAPFIKNVKVDKLDTTPYEG